MPNYSGVGVAAPIARTTNCLKRVLLTYAAWGRFSQSDTVTYTTDEITAITMSGASTMHPISVDALKATLNGEYSNDVGFYENSAAFDLTLMDKASSKAIVDQQNFCDLFLYTKWSDGSKFFQGFDYDGTNVVQLFEQQQTGHTYTRGGENDATNIVTIGFRTFTDVIYTTLEPAGLPV